MLNINNMRDYENDRASGKNSLVVMLGLKNAFVYHAFLIVGSFVCLTLFPILKQAPWYSYSFWLLSPLFIKDLITIKTTLKSGVPDRLLPKQVVQTFLLSVVFGSLLMIG